MVVKWGLSEKIGPICLTEDDEEVFLGHQITRHKNISDDTAKLIDNEIKNIINKSYETANKILRDNIDKLHLMANALIKYETINFNQILEIMNGKFPQNNNNKNNATT